jgi:hypothetical protein
MADLAITVTEVQPGAQAASTFWRGIAGEQIEAGEAFYVDESDGNKAKLADSDAAAAAAAVVKGLATCKAEAAGQAIEGQTGGPFTVGATAAPGKVPYFLSDTPGKLCPLADLGAGDRVTYVGTGDGTSVIYLKPHATGVVT